MSADDDYALRRAALEERKLTAWYRHKLAEIRAFKRVKRRETSEFDLAEAIEAEMRKTGCSQNAAIAKVAPSRNTGLRALETVRKYREEVIAMIGKATGPKS